MKLIIKIIFLFVLISLILLFIPKKTFSWDKDEEPLISFTNKAGDFSVNIREKEKEELKKIIKKVKDLIYFEATVHNPPGDMLPDNIDNDVIKEIKEKVN